MIINSWPNLLLGLGEAGMYIDPSLSSLVPALSMGVLLLCPKSSTLLSSCYSWRSSQGDSFTYGNG